MSQLYIYLFSFSYSFPLWFNSTLNIIPCAIQRMGPCLSILYIQFSPSVVSDSLQPHEFQHTRPPCPSPTPGVYSNSCPLSWWCHPAISSFVVPFSSCPQSLPASGSFQMSQLFAWGGQSIGVSASVSVLPMNTQDWSPLGGTGWISLQPTGLSRVLSNTIVQKHRFFNAQAFFTVQLSHLYMCITSLLIPSSQSFPPPLIFRS